MLGVSFDGVSENRAFAEKLDLPFPLLCDTDRALGLAYGACDAKDAGYPARISYLIDGAGRIAGAYPEVDPGRHPEQVLEDLPG